MAAVTRALPSGEVLMSVDGAVATVRLSAPQRRNALSVAMADDLVAACAEVAADLSIGAVIVTAEGPGFCAGAVRSILADAGEDPSEASRWDNISRLYAAFTAVGELPVPTIAVVAGAAVGAGLNLALATDLRLVSEGALFKSGFIDVGIHPGGGHLHLLERLIGRQTAAAMAFFGHEMSGAEAVERGLAWELQPADSLDARAHELARVAASDPELARQLVASRRMHGVGVTWEAARQIERSAQMWSMRRKSMRGAAHGIGANSGRDA